MLSVLLVATLAATPAAKIVSPPWNIVDIKPELASFYAEQMAQALRAEGMTVTTAADIQTLLGTERQKQLLGCSESGSECLIELANALGCAGTLTVNLARLGGEYRGLAKVMSSTDGSVLSSAKIEAKTEAELADRIEAAAKLLAAPWRKVEPAVAVVTTRGAPPGWWIPGAVGVAGAAVGAIFLGMAGGTVAEFERTTDSNAALELANRGEGQQTIGWLALGIGTAAIAGSVLWFFLGSSPVQPSVAVMPHGAHFGLSGSF